MTFELRNDESVCSLGGVWMSCLYYNNQRIPFYRSVQMKTVCFVSGMFMNYYGQMMLRMACD